MISPTLGNCILQNVNINPATYKPPIHFVFKSELVEEDDAAYSVKTGFHIIAN